MSRRISHIFYGVLTAFQLTLFLLNGRSIFSFACLLFTVLSWWIGARSLRTYERIKRSNDEFHANLNKLYKTQIWDRHDHE